MAITSNLYDIVKVFESQWIVQPCLSDDPNGFLFGWANEVNDVHKKDIPFMVVQPPTTSSSLQNLEHEIVKQNLAFKLQIYAFHPSTYDFKMGSSIQLASLWDKMEDCFYQWLQNCLNFMGSDVVLGDGSLNITRTKMAGNDSMFMIECSFNLSNFRHCFYLN